ncbi:MAG: lysylphosphatidylglycerol synthase transmembrane domain-containing protein [Chloroflexota bacterium]
MVDNEKKRFQFWLGMAISLACLLAIFLFVDPRQILEAIQSAHVGYAALSAAGIVAFLALRAIRWRFMLLNQVSYRQVFHIQNIGYLLTHILPFRLGDLGRAVLIGNVPPVTLAQGVSTMVVERVFDLLFMVLLLPLALASVQAVASPIRDAARVLTLLALIAIIALVLAANYRDSALRLFRWVVNRLPFLDGERWARHFDQLLVGLDSLTRLRDGLILAFLSVVVWAPIVLAYQSGMRAVGLEPTLMMSALVVCVAAISITAPSSPGQVGVFHAGVTFGLVQILRQPEAASASFAFLYHAMNFAVSIVWGLIGVYSIGSTLGNVIDAAQGLLRRDKEDVTV